MREAHRRGPGGFTVPIPPAIDRYENNSVRGGPSPKSPRPWLAPEGGLTSRLVPPSDLPSSRCVTLSRLPRSDESALSWEKRGNGRYYTRSVRLGGRIRREYVGGGLVGEAAHRVDEANRAERRRLREEEKMWLKDVEAAEHQETLALKAAATLIRAALLADGFYLHHRSDWRRRRRSHPYP
jgi:hypothetical protein